MLLYCFPYLLKKNLTRKTMKKTISFMLMFSFLLVLSVGTFTGFTEEKKSDNVSYVIKKAVEKSSFEFNKAVDVSPGAIQHSASSTGGGASSKAFLNVRTVKFDFTRKISSYIYGGIYRPGSNYFNPTIYNQVSGSVSTT